MPQFDSNEIRAAMYFVFAFLTKVMENGANYWNESLPGCCSDGRKAALRVALIHRIFDVPALIDAYHYQDEYSFLTVMNQAFERAHENRELIGNVIGYYSDDSSVWRAWNTSAGRVNRAISQLAGFSWSGTAGGISAYTLGEMCEECEGSGYAIAGHCGTCQCVDTCAYCHNGSIRERVEAWNLNAIIDGVF